MTDAKKTTRKKTVKNSTPAKKRATGRAKKTVARKTGNKKGSKASEAAPIPPKEKPDLSKTMKILGNREKHTPAVFKLPSKKNTPIVFSLEDVREVIKNRTKEKSVKKAKTRKAKGAAKKKTAEKTIVVLPQETVEAKEKRILGAASISDILGFNPTVSKTRKEDEMSRVPRKHMKYYRLLKELQNHVSEGLDMHTKDTLKIAGEEAAEIAKYSQHMADAGTDNFDRDFALSLVSSEQEALHEIEEALDRIFNGTYGRCEITGKSIARDRLEAVPFTRFSLEGQAQHEKSVRKSTQRGSVFLESTVESGVKFTDGNSDD